MTTLENAGIAETSSTSGLAKVGPAALKWFKSRGISPATLAQLPVGDGTAYFPDVDKKLPAIFFKYGEGWKARSFPEKHFVAGKGLKRTFWNLSQVLRGKLDVVYLVEGEPDACALVEAGIPASKVLACHGAKDKPTEGDPKDAAGYAYVTDGLEAGLNKVKRFIWCGDNDGAGRLLREDMLKLLGVARFHFVDWPDGVKDANDMLLSDGGEALGDLVSEGHLPWPVDGMYRLSELPEPAPMTLWEPGFPEWERKVMLAPRTLSVVTGHPGHGKTAVWNQIWFNVIKRYDIGFFGASFETRPKPHVRRQLRTLFHGILERDMNDGERATADAWINDRYLFAVHPQQRPTLEWFLELAEIAVIRHGVRVVQADPWNRFESSRTGGERDDEYVLRCLRVLYQFATDMNVHVQILAHPAKMEGARRGHPPVLEDIAGAKHWDNVVDQGFTVHRPKMYEKGQIKTEAAFYHRKARFDELGYPCRLGLDYRAKQGRFVSVDYDVV